MSENLKSILFVGIFSVLLIPLIGLNNLAFPFITGKAFAFRIIIEILGGVWLLLAIYDKRYRPRFSWLLVAIIAFIGVITLADIFGVNTYRSFWSNFERMDGLINLLHLVIYFLIAGTLLTTNKMWDRFFNTTIGVSVVLSLLGVVQLAGGMKINTDAGRLDATIGNAAYFGVYLLLHIFLTIFMLTRWQSGLKGRYIYGSIALLHIIILYFTATRSAILGLLGGVFVVTILIALLDRNHKMLRKIAIGIIIGIIMLIGGFIFVRNQSFIQQSPILSRLAAISLSGAKDQARYYLWSIAVEGFKERPILGWGQENFKIVFFKHYDPALYNDEIIFDRPHNVILEWLVAGGLLGALGYLSLFGVVLYYLWFSKKGNWSIVEKSILTGFLAGYFINGLFLFDTLTSYIIFFGFLAYIHSQILPEYQEEKIRHKLIKKYEQKQQNWIKNFTVPVIVVVSFSLYFVNAKVFLAASEYASAFFFYKSEPVKSLDQFKKALSYDSFSYEKIRQEVAIVAINMKDGLSIDSKIKQDYFNLARSEMEKQVKEMPPDAHNFYLLGSLLYSYGELDEALLFLEKAKELSPKKQIIILKLVDVYIAKKDYKKAYELAQKVYELEPRYDLARNMYAASAILLGDNKTASSVLIERYGTDTLFDLKILQAYADTKQYDKIITTYEKRILEKPDDAQTKFSLSVAYVKIGQRQMAIKTLEDAIVQNPVIKDTAIFFISEIQAGRIPQ
ncbi:MAG: O-antigen ligase family protein [bacterium]|nr:O-antigen ligase family protein [bacterium]